MSAVSSAVAAGELDEAVKLADRQQQPLPSPVEGVPVANAQDGEVVISSAPKAGEGRSTSPSDAASNGEARDGPAAVDEPAGGPDTQGNGEEELLTEVDLDIPIPIGDIVGMVINREGLNRDPYDIDFPSHRIGLKMRAIPAGNNEKKKESSCPQPESGGSPVPHDACATESPSTNETPAQEAFLVCGFLDYDLDLKERPEFGARLVAVDGTSIEYGSWTFECVCDQIRSKEAGGGVRLTFRNDKLSKEDIAYLNGILSHRTFGLAETIQDPSPAPEALPRPSLIQRIDRYLSPPSKLIIDHTVGRRDSGSLNVDFPRNGRRTATRDSSWSAFSRQTSIAPANTATSKSAVLLWGSTSTDAHYQKIRHVLETARGMHGGEGLEAVGFEYRFVRCPMHLTVGADDSGDGEETLCGASETLSPLAELESLPLDEGGGETGSPEFCERRERAQSDAGVEYRTPNSLADMKASHQMIIVPSHPANAGDLVESAAIRERLVQGFDDRRNFRRMSSSAVSLETVDYDSGGNGRNDEEGNGQGQDNQTVESDGVQSADLLATEASNEVLGASSPQSASHEGGNFPQSPGAENNANSNATCSDCATRLFHVESNTMITLDNLTRFIASGSMYDEVARLCQEYAQDVMKDEGSLVWVTICDDRTRGEPVRVLVDENHSDLPGPILMVVTGKGKVRAGVFSRQHLLATGLECSTALPMLREAKRRKWKVALLDPNARGDREGMVTFEMSVRALFGEQSLSEDAQQDSLVSSLVVETQTHTQFKPLHHDSPMYVLSYSASGAQLVRYLMDQSHYLLPRIAAIAFTDSTHNIQWTKNNTSLSRMLESPACVYVRSANEHRDDWERHRPGDVVETDHHWQRRFGLIRTIWAGTKEHGLTNFVAHSHIWDHFDRHSRHFGGVSVDSSQSRKLLAFDNGKHDEDEEDGISVSSRSSCGSHPRRLRARSFEVMTV